MAAASSISVLASAYTPPRQVDPSTVQSQNPYPPDLVAFYRDFIRLLGDGNFSGALSQLNQSGLIHVPSSIQFVYSRFNSLLSTATQQLEQVNSSISMVKSYLSSGDLNDANLSLYQGFFMVSEANANVLQLKSAAPQVESSFGIPTGQLSSEVEQLSLLEQTYVGTLNQLSGQLTSLENGLHSGRIQPTSLTLSASATTLYVGDNLTLFGRLTSNNGSALSGQNILINSSYGQSYSVKTGAGGSFVTQLTIPYIYQHFALLVASFSPANAENMSFLPSRSNQLNLTLLFYQPSLPFSVPGSVYPGTTFEVNGSYSNSTLSPQITISAFGQDVQANYSFGRFTASVYVPPGISSGQYTVIATASPFRDVGPASSSQTLLVVRVPAKVEFHPPGVVFGGEPLQISGYAESVNGTPLSDAQVAVNLAGRSVTTQTGSDGSFNLSFNVPILVGTGRNEIVFVVSPSHQPWVSASYESFPLTTFNLTVVVLPLTLLLLGALVYNRRRRAEAGLETSVIPPQRPTGFPPLPPSLSTARGAPSSDVRSTYMRIVSILESRGIVYRPQMTPREYLAAVSSQLPMISKLFEMLTTLFEDDVYGFGSSEEAAHQARATEELLVGILLGKGSIR
jgi:hypothetical protein